MPAPSRYPIPAGRSRVEDEIKHSRFITTIAPAPTEEDARVFIDAVRAEFPDATHNCWAYVVGYPGSTRANGASDDGEPSGTAGRPMLGALLGADVGDVAVVVTRYFGGVKLGRGGLVRAYSGGVQRALREMPRAERRPHLRLIVTLPYAAVDVVRRLLEAHEAEVEKDEYGEGAIFAIFLPEDRRGELERAVRDATSGAAEITPVPGDDE